MKSVGLSQFIPQLLKFNGGLYSAFSAKNPHSFAQHEDCLPPHLGLADQRLEGGQESLAVRPHLFHEVCEDFSCIQKEKASLRDGTCKIYAACLQALKKALPMGFGDDDDHRTPGLESGLD